MTRALHEIGEAGKCPADDGIKANLVGIVLYPGPGNTDIVETQSSRRMSHETCLLAVTVQEREFPLWPGHRQGDSRQPGSGPYVEHSGTDDEGQTTGVHRHPILQPGAVS